MAYWVYIVVNYHTDKLEQWSILNNISINIFSNLIERKVAIKDTVR
jgi:hypothetical protein